VPIVATVLYSKIGPESQETSTWYRSVLPSVYATSSSTWSRLSRSAVTADGVADSSVRPRPAYQRCWGSHSA
jgi:hypothetical protein